MLKINFVSFLCSFSLRRGYVSECQNSIVESCGRNMRQEEECGNVFFSLNNYFMYDFYFFLKDTYVLWTWCNSINQEPHKRKKLCNLRIWVSCTKMQKKFLAMSANFGNINLLHIQGQRNSKCLLVTSTMFTTEFFHSKLSFVKDGTFSNTLMHWCLSN